MDNLSLSIQRENSENSLLSILKLNGVDISNIVSHWKIQQGAGQSPELVLTIPLSNVPQIVL